MFNPLEEEISCKRVNTNGMLIDIATSSIQVRREIAKPPTAPCSASEL
jgi:hypothetical protein